MLITRIVRQKRKKNLFSVFLDGTYSFSLCDESLVRHQLKEGQEVQPEMVTGILSDDEKRRAMDYALKLFGIRSRSTRELRERLRQQEFSEPAAAHAIDRLTELAYLNDVRFADEWSGYLASKGDGPELIRAELRKKGIDSAIIADVLARRRENPEREAERLKEIARRKLNAIKDRDPKAATRRITGYLVRKGYSIENIRHALHELLHDETGDTNGD